MKKAFIFLVVSFIAFNCTKEKSKKNQEKPEKKTSCQIPDIQTISKNDINPLFVKELLDKNGIQKMNFINESKLFHKGEICLAQRLYFQTIPKTAGEYENNTPFKIFDLIYSNPESASTAFNNLKHALNNQNKYIDNVQFDYFKGNLFIYFLDKPSSKISVVASFYPNTKNYDKIMTFSKNNKDKFDEVISGTPTGLEVIK